MLGGGAGMGGGLFGAQAGQPQQQQQQMMMGAAPNMDAYGLGNMVTANRMPPRPIGLILPRSPARSSSGYLWKAQPESASKMRPNDMSRPTSQDGSGADRSPRSAGSFSLPPSAAPADRPLGSATPRSRPHTPATADVSPASLLRVSMSARTPTPPTATSRDREPGAPDSMPPLRRPRETSPPKSASYSRQEEEATMSTKMQEDMPVLQSPAFQPIKPNFLRHSPDGEMDDERDGTPAPASLVPLLARPEYYSSPSVEAMAGMSEAKLSRIDNLEIGRYGYGTVRWPGLTDVRRVNFDEVISIDRGSLTLYPEGEKPAVGSELNKQAVITLHVRPSRTDAKLKSVDVLRARLTKISEDFGGKFISYDMEKWIFHVPHFNGIQGA